MEQERDLCHFCKESKIVERTYLYPSKYIKEQGSFVNKYLYNEGDYFIIVKTCADCGTPQLPQQEKSLSDKWKEYQDWLNETPEISDEEIEEEISKRYMHPTQDYAFRDACKWYREQLKQRQ